MSEHFWPLDSGGVINASGIDLVPTRPYRNGHTQATQSISSSNHTHFLQPTMWVFPLTIESILFLTYNMCYYVMQCQAILGLAGNVSRSTVQNRSSSSVTLYRSWSLRSSAAVLCTWSNFWIQASRHHSKGSIQQAL